MYAQSSKEQVARDYTDSQCACRHGFRHSSNGPEKVQQVYALQEHQSTSLWILMSWIHLLRQATSMHQEVRRGPRGRCTICSDPVSKISLALCIAQSNFVSILGIFFLTHMGSVQDNSMTEEQLLSRRFF